MDIRQQLLLIEGKDKTASVESVQFQGEFCLVRYQKNATTYHYRANKVQQLSLRATLSPADVMVYVDGTPLYRVQEILDFGSYYRIIGRDGRSCRLYAKGSVELHKNCLTRADRKQRFDFFREIAAQNQLTAQDGQNILENQYADVRAVSEQTVLSTYLSRDAQPESRTPPRVLIYPFGMNRSQKKAVEQAFSSQVSIIQGPPGTGKTQTILNILANAVREGKSVAVVSNNNSATRNVVEKLSREHLDFLTAFLGKEDNKREFLKAQTGRYPDMTGWQMAEEQRRAAEQEVLQLSRQLQQLLEDRNRIAAIDQELQQLEPEQREFERYWAGCAAPRRTAEGLPSRRVLALWAESEQDARRGRAPGLLRRLLLLFRFGGSSVRLLCEPPERVIPHLQHTFYQARRRELQEEREHLENKLEAEDLAGKLQRLSRLSMDLLRSELARRYPWQEPRPQFVREDFFGNARAFNREYPIVLSTTYSIRNTLTPGYLYDYLIVDEASQVALDTGVLALSCARNVVIVGDLQQLPNVLDDHAKAAGRRIEQSHPVEEPYRFTRHSLLSSAVSRWPRVPPVLLREHYRCHPRIIQFCNRKFYADRLIVLTQDHGERDVLTICKTPPGSQGRTNQLQIDILKQQVLPRLRQSRMGSIGVIAPYRDQVNAIRCQLGGGVEVDTVHGYQGREKDAIVMTSVDTVISRFVDDPRMLNVAVSRAVKSLTVITSDDPRNDRTNYGDLTRYVAYNSGEVIDSRVYPVFELLYRGYEEQRRADRSRQRPGPEREDRLHGVIGKVLARPEYRTVGCAVHVALGNILRDLQPYCEEDCRHIRNPRTHVAFLLYRRMGQQPLLAVGPDDAARAEQDERTDRILRQAGIPVLRLRADGGGEQARLEQALQSLLV